MKTTLSSLLLLTSLAACGGTEASSLSDPTEPSTDAATEAATDAAMEAATDAATDAAASCGVLQNIADEIAFVAEASHPPPASGGPIFDGVYILASATIYTGVGGKSGPTEERRRMTVLISNGGKEAASVFDGVVRTAALTTDGTLLRSVGICPAQKTDESSYTSTGSTLAIHQKDGGKTIVLAFTKIEQ